jgi:hypothetical protein
MTLQSFHTFGTTTCSYLHFEFLHAKLLSPALPIHWVGLLWSPFSQASLPSLLHLHPLQLICAATNTFLEPLHQQLQNNMQKWQGVGIIIVHSICKMHISLMKLAVQWKKKVFYKQMNPQGLDIRNLTNSTRASKRRDSLMPRTFQLFRSCCVDGVRWDIKDERWRRPR